MVPKLTKRKALVIGIGVLLAVIGLSFAFGQPKTWPAWLITRDEPLEKADAVFLLMGSVATRTPKAIQLLQQGWAPQVIFAQVATSQAESMGIIQNDADATLRLLRHAQIDDQRIVRLPNIQVASTRDEAKAMFDYLAQNMPDAKRVILVTDWYHSSRARWIFEKYRPPHIQLISSSSMSEKNEPDTWYLHEDSFILTIIEYIKWLFYLIHY